MGLGCLRRTNSEWALTGIVILLLKSSIGWGLVKVGVADQENVVECVVPCGGDWVRVFVVPLSDEEAGPNQISFLRMKIGLIPP